MDLSLSEQQEMLKKTARDFLEAECPKTLVRQMEKDETGYSQELWRKMAELGWMALLFPEKYGGMGGSFLDLAVLLEEMGRALLPSPFLSTVVNFGLPILNFGTDEQKLELLPKIAKGELIGTLALLESNPRYDPKAIEAWAYLSGDEYILSGVKLFAPYAHVADRLLVVARTSNSAVPEEGITIFIVDAKGSGVSLKPLTTIALDKQSEVRFERVRIPKGNVLGEVNKGWPIAEAIMREGAVARCAEMLGIAQQVFEMTVEYAKERVQFGRPIGGFEIVQGYVADMATDTDGCRFTTYEAAWKIAEGMPSNIEVAVAKGWVSSACRRVVLRAHEIFGGIGFMEEHDLQLFTRRAKMMEIDMGDTRYYEEKVADELGL